MAISFVAMYGILQRKSCKTYPTKSMCRSLGCWNGFFNVFKGSRSIRVPNGMQMSATASRLGVSCFKAGHCLLPLMTLLLISLLRFKTWHETSNDGWPDLSVAPRSSCQPLVLLTRVLWHAKSSLTKPQEKGPNERRGHVQHVRYVRHVMSFSSSFLGDTAHIVSTCKPYELQK